MASHPAFAHPFGDGYAAQRLDVRIDRDGVDIGYLADVPDPFIAPTVDDAAVERMFDQLARGLVLNVDGATVPTAVVTREARQDLVTMHSRVLELVLRADVPLTGAHVVDVSNSNLAGEPCYYLSTLVIPPSARVTDSSLLAAPRDAPAVDLSTRWSRSELRRRVKVTLAIPDGAWPALVDRLRTPDGGVDHLDLLSAHATPWAAWRTGAHTLGAASGAAAAAGVATALTASARSARHGAAAAAALILALAARTAGLWAPLPALAAIALAAMWIGLRRSWPTGWVAVALLLGGLPWVWRPLLMGGALVGAALGVCAPRPAPAWVHAAWILGVGLCLAAWGTG